MQLELLATVGALLLMIVVGFWAMRALKAPDQLKLAATQLADARVKALQHTAAAEEHASAASMYTVRMERLEGMLVLKGDAK